MTENDYTPTQITLPNGIVGRVNNPDDPIALEFMRTFQEVAKALPGNVQKRELINDSHAYTRRDIDRAYETLRSDYGLIEYKEVMADRRFVHLVFADGMELDYVPSIEFWRVNLAQEMIDFVMRHKHLPFDSEGGE